MDDEQTRGKRALGVMMTLSCQAVRECFVDPVSVTLIVTSKDGSSNAILHDGDMAGAAAALQREIVKERDASGEKVQ